MTEKALSIVFISLSGNTLSFAKRLQEHLQETYNLVADLVDIKALNHENFPITTPFVALLPTYLEGGNGIDSGSTEILTNPLGDFIAAYDNFQKCFGIIGSGNRNFNEQYCLTAKQYAKRFGFSMLGDFELRGTNFDVERLSKIIVNHYQNFKKTQP